uniref:60S ribosomal protein L17-2 n=1 Tax=Rhizophora mucronata TaxID=61149 RepID=A0A2P2KHB6_RHIMU
MNGAICLSTSNNVQFIGQRDFGWTTQMKLILQCPPRRLWQILLDYGCPKLTALVDGSHACYLPVISLGAKHPPKNKIISIVFHIVSYQPG